MCYNPRWAGNKLRLGGSPHFFAASDVEPPIAAFRFAEVEQH